MRKLKLQMQITVDGFVAGPEGQLDWMTWNWDPQLTDYVNQLTDSSSTILLGRKMTPGFVSYWEEAAAKPGTKEYDFAQKMVGYEKVVFSRTLQRMDGKNLRVYSGDLVEGVNAIKNMPGKDVVVYGGATFVAALIEHGLIDELNFFVSPVAIGKGLQVFNGKTPMTLASCTAYPVGVVVSTYRPG